MQVNLLYKHHTYLGGELHDMFDVLKHILWLFYTFFDIKTAVAILRMRSLVWVIMRLKVFNLKYSKVLHYRYLPWEIE